MCRYSVHSSVLLLLIMICNISYCANRDDFLCTLFSDFKLKAIVVINPYGIKAIIKCLKVERIEHKKILDTCCRHQRINTLLVLLPVVIELFEIVFFVFYVHRSLICVQR